MNARERVRAVLNHKIPDWVPCGLGGCETAGLHVLTYEKLQKSLGVEPKPPRMDTFMCNAVFEPELLKAMQGDILMLASPRMCRSPLLHTGVQGQWKNQQLWGHTISIPVKEHFSQRPDGTMVWESSPGKEICPPGSFFFDAPSATDLLQEFDYPDPEDYRPDDDFSDDFLRALEETARYWYEETDFCLSLGETITDLQYSPGGMIGGMVLMMEQPEVMQAYLQKAVDAALKQITLLEQAVGKYVDILCIAHDFGDNQGVTIGDELWRRIYKPYYRQLFQGWHARTGMKINLHTCGSVSSILEDLVACGLDIYNPVQTSAKGMTPEELKKRFGDRLIFYGGGYDCQLLPHDTPAQEVYQKVRQVVGTFKQGGNYIFAGVHNLPADVPQAHLEAMLAAWRDERVY